MADFQAAISGIDVKNGSMVVGMPPFASAQTVDTYVLNTPTIATIATKYADRFDDPSYYYGNGTQGT